MNNKRKLTASPPPFAEVSRQLRSNLPRRKRQHFSPVISFSLRSFCEAQNQREVKKNCSGFQVHAESCVVSNSTTETKTRNQVEDSQGTSNVAGSTSELESASRRNGIEDSKEAARSGILSLRKVNEGTSNEAGSTSMLESASDSVNLMRNYVKKAKLCDENEECEVESGVQKSGISNEGTSNVAGCTSMLESASRRNGISSLSKLHKGTSNVAGSTSMLESASNSVNLRNYVKNAKLCGEDEECEVESGVQKSGISSLSRVNEGTTHVAGSTSMLESASDSVNLMRNYVKKGKLCDEDEECEVESGVQKSELSTIGFGIENDVVSVDSVKLSTEETVSFPGANVDEFDLECSESFSNENSSQQSHSYSSVYSSVYFESEEFESEEYSTWFDSGSQFSEKSDPDGVPSRTFQLLNQFSDQFYRSSLFENSSHKLITSDYSSDEVTLLGLENEEDEDNYRMLKSRERRQLYLRDYAAEYCCTGNGQLIIEQRLEMVHWIFEHSTNMELQSETMFLGINLLDRFFSKGYFKTKRSLQIAGIACLTLATRIEENQPYNSIRKKTFYVGNTAYSRCEVVAMEWLVQEILNFQCFLPTLYNFLWFYLKAVRANEAVGKTVGYLATLAMLSHEQMCYWPSTVAASLVILACKAAESDAHCHLLIESHGREKDDTLPECIKRLEWLVKYC